MRESFILTLLLGGGGFENPVSKPASEGLRVTISVRGGGGAGVDPSQSLALPPSPQPMSLGRKMQRCVEEGVKVFIDQVVISPHEVRSKIQVQGGRVTGGGGIYMCLR